ncbi:hypothetical protein ERN12_14610 [Rhodobacteraceae bacterium]|nr:hypothetical protein ERN12_14610 [Paracoccaceae bacterium]
MIFSTINLGGGEHMSYDNRHSMMVTWAKIALPLAALVLLSMVFMVGRSGDQGQILSYSNVNLEQLANEPQLNAPEYSGVTRDGAALSVRAASAVLGDSQQSGAQATQMVAKLQMRDGLVADLSAKSGQFQPQSDQVTLDQDVALQLSSGYQVTTDRVDMATDRSRLVSPGPVDAKAPMGTLHAGAMELAQPEPGAAHDLIFTKGVKLVYQPKD